MLNTSKMVQFKDLLPLLSLLWFAFTSRDCLISAATFSRMGHGIGPGTLILHLYAAIFCSLMGWRAAGLPCQVELYLSPTALCSWAGHRASLSLQVPPRSRAALRINTENPGCCLGLPGGLLEALFLPCVDSFPLPAVLVGYQIQALWPLWSSGVGMGHEQGLWWLDFLG